MNKDGVVSHILISNYRLAQEDKSCLSRICFDAALNFELDHLNQHRNQRTYKIEIQVLKVLYTENIHRILPCSIIAFISICETFNIFWIKCHYLHS